MGLGINKDLEPLARRVRKLGGTVDVTAGGHVKWILPDGTVLRTGLTMRDTTARLRMRAIERALCPEVPPKHFYEVQIGPKGKYIIVDAMSQEALRNANGYPRSFATERAARQHLKSDPNRWARVKVLAAV